MSPLPAKYAFVAFVSMPLGSYCPANGLQISFQDYCNSVIPASPAYPHWKNYQFASVAPAGITPPQVWWNLDTNSYISPQGANEQSRLRRRAEKCGSSLSSSKSPRTIAPVIRFRPAGSENDPSYDAPYTSRVPVPRRVRGRGRPSPFSREDSDPTSSRGLTLEMAGRSRPLSTSTPSLPPSDVLKGAGREWTRTLSKLRYMISLRMLGSTSLPLPQDDPL